MRLDPIDPDHAAIVRPNHRLILRSQSGALHYLQTKDAAHLGSWTGISSTPFEDTCVRYHTRTDLWRTPHGEFVLEESVYHPGEGNDPWGTLGAEIIPGEVALEYVLRLGLAVPESLKEVYESRDLNAQPLPDWIRREFSELQLALMELLWGSTAGVAIEKVLNRLYGESGLAKVDSLSAIQKRVNGKLEDIRENVERLRIIRRSGKLHLRNENV